MACRWGAWQAVRGCHRPPATWGHAPRLLGLNAAPAPGAPALRPAEKPPVLKRAIKSPRDGFSLTNVSMETITAIPYDIIKEGIM